MLRGGQVAPGSNRMALVYECSMTEPSIQMCRVESPSLSGLSGQLYRPRRSGLVVGAVICNGQQRSAVVPGAEPQVESATALSNFESAWTWPARPEIVARDRHHSIRQHREVA